ncbi:MAG: bifunctional diaminohydroxyphosphoribosylaminopyrimidine deaminase/5-amino-6-(5-phosphoribosylamino)uracil reductase RibD [Candidatus Thioglobus sp.]|nr:bifunctional diaminohydroxyphosphoribosylaminopyrimidine deaminase/5-amino-6-(5-phosphoribosylamino)uracil reductase RibD [Candidatus Thioglobus sp.]
MGLALKLARQGMHGVGANPMVGCVIEKDGDIIAKGYHQTFGQAHAEINALEQINHQANDATLYVTLEPCSHQGKTPPCAQAIIDSGAKKVIIAMLDPNPLVSGQGVAMLETAGIEVELGLLEDQAVMLNRGFIKRMTTKRPFVTCKIAMSLDGKTSMQSGQSKWITDKNAREDVQRLRASNQAIMTGSGTVLADNPSMTVRSTELNVSPIRVVVDGKHQVTDQSLNIFSTATPTQIFNTDNTNLNQSGKLDLNHILLQLGEQGVNSVLLEAGPGLIGAMIENALIDELIIYTAPTLLGSNANSMATLPIDNMQDQIKLSISDLRLVGNDIRITATIKP